MGGGYKDGNGVQIPDPFDFDALPVQIEKNGIGQIVGEKGGPKA